MEMVKKFNKVEWQRNQRRQFKLRNGFSTKSNYRERKFAPLLPEAVKLRNSGLTYQRIANHFKVSIATVWKYLSCNQEVSI